MWGPSKRESGESAETRGWLLAGRATQIVPPRGMTGRQSVTRTPGNSGGAIETQPRARRHCCHTPSVEPSSKCSQFNSCIGGVAPSSTRARRLPLLRGWLPWWLLQASASARSLGPDRQVMTLAREPGRPIRDRFPPRWCKPWCKPALGSSQVLADSHLQLWVLAFVMRGLRVRLPRLALSKTRCHALTAGCFF